MIRVTCFLLGITFLPEKIEEGRVRQSFKYMSVSKTRQEGEKHHGLSESVWRRKREGTKENLRVANEHVRGVLRAKLSGRRI